MTTYVVSFLYTRTGRNVEIAIVQATSDCHATGQVAANMKATGTKWPRGAVLIADAV